VTLRKKIDHFLVKIYIIKKGVMNESFRSMESSNSLTLSRGIIVTSNNYDVWSIKMKFFP
jgi:hypothetical protein